MPDSSGIYDVEVETSILDVPDHCLGVQYDGERAVAFYSMYDESTYAYDGNLYEYDIFNDSFQILLKELPQELINGNMIWYRTTGGHYYVYNKQSFYFLDEDGEELCWQHIEGELVQIAETRGQDIVMLFYDSGHYLYHLGLFYLEEKKLEDKGQLTEVDAMQRTYYLKWNTISYNPTQGKIMDYRQTGNGECELLTYSYDKDRYYRDLLAVKSFDEEGRSIITYRTGYATDSMKNMVVAFNQSQSEYYVVLESSQLGSAMDDGQKNAIEIAAGRGPDLIDDSKINTEDMDISTLLYCLETYEKDKVVFNNKYIYIPLKILNYYLELSDDLYGMIDWENHTCDFDNPLWYRMLETANRYGFRNGRNNYEDVAYLGFFTDFPSYMEGDNDARNDYMIPVGHPVEDTMSPVLHLTAIGINSQSPNKEGAWAFLEFCLSQTAQFNGDKSAEEVTRIIENRVGLYLQEID